MLGILGWIVFGLVIGALAKLVMPGRDPGGILVTMRLGIAGALIGGFVDRAGGFYQPGEPAGFIMATTGALLLASTGGQSRRRDHGTSSDHIQVREPTHAELERD